MNEIIQALNILQIPYFYSFLNAYPKDWLNKGRIKVDIGNREGNSILKKKISSIFKKQKNFC